MADLPRALASLDQAIGAAGPFLDAATRGRLERRLDEVTRRHGFLGPTVVAALAGGTGSGKSTLLNALAGREVAETGVVRPTTAAPTAWVPEEPDPNLLALLDDLGIDRRTGHGGAEHLAVVDLPDLDSVELSHRATVDALLPRLDLVIWVLDPSKYNDRSIHDRVADRRDYAPQTLFVLNQVDRLSAEEEDAVAADLIRTLRRDGIDRPDVVLAAAAPRTGPPRGVDEIAGRVAALARDKRLVLDKIASDLRRIADDLEDAVGGVAIDDRALTATWESARDDAAERIARSMVDEVTEQRAAAAGARAVVAVGSGPLGRLWHGARRSFVGRAVGLPADEPVSPRALITPVGETPIDGAASTVSRAVTDISTAVGGAAGRHLRAQVPVREVGSELSGAVEAARSSVPAPRDIPRRGWWVGAAVLQTLLTLAVVVGAGWWWIDPSAVAPGDVPWPAVLVLGGLALTVVIARIVRASGRRVGRLTVAEHRRELSRALGVAIDERLGAPTRTMLGDVQRFGQGLHHARRAL